MAQRKFKARVRLSAGRATEVTVMAANQAEAKARIEAQYGRGAVQAWLPC